MYTLSPEAILSLHHSHAREHATARQLAPAAPKHSRISALENIVARIRAQIPLLPAPSAPAATCCS